MAAGLWPPSSVLAADGDGERTTSRSGLVGSHFDLLFGSLDLSGVIAPRGVGWGWKSGSFQAAVESGFGRPVDAEVHEPACLPVYHPRTRVRRWRARRPARRQGRAGPCRSPSAGSSHWPVHISGPGGSSTTIGPARRSSTKSGVGDVRVGGEHQLLRGCPPGSRTPGWAPSRRPGCPSRWPWSTPSGRSTGRPTPPGSNQRRQRPAGSVSEVG